MENKMTRIAVLIGKGGRLPAILECAGKLRDKVTVRLAVSHKKESPGVELAKSRGIESFCMYWYGRKKEGTTREEFCRELARILTERQIDLVVMAGWDVILAKEYFDGFSGATMNIHPSLLPAFAGFHGAKVQEEVLKSGIKETGATLHFVTDEGVDTGPIIMQERVAVEEADTVESLEAKIHNKEENMLCEGIRLFAEGKLQVKAKKITAE